LDIIARARAIVLSPATEWRAIESESGDTGYLFTNYVAILAAIPVVARFLRRVFIGGYALTLGQQHFGFFSSLVGAIAQYFATFVIVYALALIIDALAPTFSARKNQENAMKLAVYSMTPAWLAGAFGLIPGLGFLRILGLYGIYLFWLGLPILMKPPADRMGPYTLAVILCAIVLRIVAATVLGA
jgi:hypothetical protein